MADEITQQAAPAVPAPPVKLKDRVENHPAVFYLAAVVVGFVAGIGTYAGALKIVDYEAVPSKAYQALKEAAQKPAAVQQRWIRVRGVQGLIDVDARVVVLVNGHAYSYPSRTIWTRLRPNMPSEDFALPMDTSNYAVSFQMFVLSAKGNFRQFGSQQVLSLGAAPSEGLYELSEFSVGETGLTKHFTVCVDSRFPQCADTPSSTIRIAFELR